MATTDAALIGVNDRTPPAGGAPRLDVTLWRPGKEPVHAQLDDVTPDGDEIVWVDITSDGVNAAELRSQLETQLPHARSDMLKDLLKPDHYPDGKDYEGTGVRLASTFRVEAQDRHPEVAKRRDVFPGPGDLLLQPVELLAGKGWLISCWHPQRIYNGIRISQELPAEACDPFRLEVAIRWQHGTGKTSGDLGVMLMYELALSYSPARHKLYDWLEEAELSLYVTSDIDREALARLWASMTLFRHWLTPLNVAGLPVEPDKAWLPNVTDTKTACDVDERVESALGGLRRLATALRSAFGALYSQLEQRGRDQREATQRRVELIAAAFLVPSLIVGFYGANTWLPGQGSHTGKTAAFIEMLMALILLTGLIVFLLWQWHRHQEQEVRKLDAQTEKWAELLKEPSDDSLSIETPTA